MPVGATEREILWRLEEIHARHRDRPRGERDRLDGGGSESAATEGRRTAIVKTGEANGDRED